MEKFCTAAAEAGIDGALVTDLPVEEAGDYLRAMKGHKLAPVFLAAPTSTDERLRAIARHSRGFVYAIAHIRGGSDKGWSWYLDGKREKKTNTFDDFAAAGRALIARGKMATSVLGLGSGLESAAAIAETLTRRAA